MIKAIFGIGCFLLGASIALIGLGFYKLFEMLGFWAFLPLSIYAVLLIAQIVLIAQTLCNLRFVFEEIKTAVKDAISWLKGLTPMQILKLILGILKK